MDKLLTFKIFVYKNMNKNGIDKVERYSKLKKVKSK